MSHQVAESLYFEKMERIQYPLVKKQLLMGISWDLMGIGFNGNVKGYQILHTNGNHQIISICWYHNQIRLDDIPPGKLTKLWKITMINLQINYELPL